MTSYHGRHAELYDLFYRDKPYEQEAAFVHECLQRFGDGPIRRLLELACGTAGHALALEKHGYLIEAIDNSEDMITRARAKAAGLGSGVVLRLEDMRQLAVPLTPFDAAICLFDSIGYVRTNEGLRQVLEGVFRSLREGGLFIFEFWHAAAMLRHYDRVRVRSWETETGEIVRIAETRLEPAMQAAHVRYRVYALRKDGSYSSFEETHVNRYFLLQEMEHWLETTGFVPVKWFAGFTGDEHVREDTWHILAVTRKAPPRRERDPRAS